MAKNRRRKKLDSALEEEPLTHHPFRTSLVWERNLNCVKALRWRNFLLQQLG